MAGSQRRVRILLAVSAALATVVGLTPATSSAAAPAAATYRNPVSASFADTYADPAVIRGKDGWWYAYGTTDPLREGERTRHLLPISRSRNLVDWTYVGDAFTESTLPTWADTGRAAALWAPDIRYVNGQYRLYYVVTQTTVTPGPNDNAIGVATAPTPVGPWTDSGAPVVGPRPGASGNPDDFLWTFDPTMVVDTDGTQHLFYGSYYGGIWVTELNATGTRATGTPTMVAIDNKFEGAYVVRRGGWWYLMASLANCCAGPTTGYSVQVGRSRDLRGPYVDRLGVRLDISRAGGTPVIAPNGNRWVGTGHNAIVTDLAGQDWFVYHAIDRNDPYLDEPFGINERPMLIDRLDWVGGWPTVRAGRWASEGAQRGPALPGRWSTSFNGGIPAGWSRTGAWTTATERDAGRYAVTPAGLAWLLAGSTVGRDLRAEVDLRLTAGTRAGLLVRARHSKHSLVAYVDRASRSLVLARGGPRPAATRVPLPAIWSPTSWTNLVLEVRDGVARAEVSYARLGDPLAVARLRVPGGVRPHSTAGAVSWGAGAHVDNLSVLPAAHLVTRAVPPPRRGELDPSLSDEFNGPTLAPWWTWVRTPRGTLTGGALRWPTEAADLTGTSNNASILLRDAPAGDWTAETKVTIDLGTDTVRNFQQAGIIAYLSDDHFTRLSHVAIWNTRQTEFGKEMPFANGLSYGGTIIGPPADTTWLRIYHRTNPATGEHVLRAATSTDGRTWVFGGAWTLPAGTQLRIGLVSHGGAGATADFDWFRVYR